MESRYKRHAALVDRMATAQGLDLEEQMMRGRLGFMQLEDAVLNCTGCSSPCACERWLEEQPAAVDEPPTYCRNRTLFATLRDG